MSKLLSIITPTYKDKKIFETYESIKNLLQNRLVEWVVIDGFVDERNNLGEQIGNIQGVKYLNQKDDGIYDAMNKGIKNADGDYLWFLNGGDALIMNDADLMSEIEKGKNDGHQWLKFNFSINKKIRDERISPIFLILNSPNHQASILSRKLFLPRAYNSNLNLAADYQMFLEIFFIAKIKPFAISQALFNYDLEGITSKPEQKNKIRQERIASTKNVLNANFHPYLLLAWVLQIFVYFPFIMVPSLKFKRFHD
tara:strand:+ start:850 stop:1611 length:762 start_codon:yes stop_codon:yes gene_type:complete